MRKLYALFLVLVCAVAALIAACGSDTETSGFDPNAIDGGNTSSGDPPIIGGGDAAIDAEALSFTITPVDPVVTFTSGQPSPTVQFKAVTAGGLEVPASFSIDRGEIGTVALTTGLFTASGTVGGKAKITATRNGKTASTTVTVKLKISDNGLTGVDAGADGGSGGAGGVGGEGPGGPFAPSKFFASRVPYEL